MLSELAGDWKMTATYNVNIVSLLLSVLCLGIVLMGGWYFQSSIVELRTDLMEKNKEIAELNKKLNKSLQSEKSQSEASFYEALQV